MITIAITRKQAQPAPNYGQKEKQTQAQPQTQAADSTLPSIATRIRLVDNPKSRIKAEASVNIGGAYAVHGLRVVEGAKGTFVSMPQRQYTDQFGETKYAEIFHAVTGEARQAIINSVSQAYEQAVAQAQNQAQDQAQAQSEDASETMSAPNM